MLIEGIRFEAAVTGVLQAFGTLHWEMDYHLVLQKRIEAQMKEQGKSQTEMTVNLRSAASSR
jgi:hypothetical protein